MVVIVVVVVIIIVIIVICCSNIPIDRFMSINYPVDAVITFRGEKFNVNNNREGYNYEIKYCIRAISKNMPWIRKIYILQNDADIPSFFSKNYEQNNVFLYGHSEIIPQKYLPTTNSDSIETFLTLLPGLSEHFVYFCDDIFVRKEMPIDYFFTAFGVPKRVKFPRMYLPQIGNKMKSPPSPGVWYPHIPIPYTKSEINAYLNEYSEFIEYVRSIRERKDKIFDVCHNIGLTFPCMQLHTGVDFMNRTNNGYYGIDIADYYFYPNDILKIESGTKPFFCIGDHSIGSLQERNQNRNKLRIILEKIFSEKSRAEK